MDLKTRIEYRNQLFNISGDALPIHPQPLYAGRRIIDFESLRDIEGTEFVVRTGSRCVETR